MNNNLPKRYMYRAVEREYKRRKEGENGKKTLQFFTAIAKEKERRGREGEREKKKIPNSNNVNVYMVKL